MRFLQCTQRSDTIRRKDCTLTSELAEIVGAIRTMIEEEVGLKTFQHELDFLLGKQEVPLPATLGESFKTMP
jgi:hypothetical protein